MPRRAWPAVTARGGTHRAAGVSHGVTMLSAAAGRRPHTPPQVGCFVQEMGQSSPEKMALRLSLQAPVPRATWVLLSGPRPRRAGAPPRGGPVVARAGGFSPSCPPSSTPLCTHTRHSEQRGSVGVHTHTRPTCTHTRAPTSAHTCGTTRVRARHARTHTHTEDTALT